MEAEVLQQDDGSGGGVSAGGFHLRTHAVLQEGDVPAEPQRTSEDARAMIVSSRSNTSSYNLDRISSVFLTSDSLFGCTVNCVSG